MAYVRTACSQTPLVRRLREALCRALRLWVLGDAGVAARCACGRAFARPQCREAARTPSLSACGALWTGLSASWRLLDAGLSAARLLEPRASVLVAPYGQASVPRALRATASVPHAHGSVHVPCPVSVPGVFGARSQYPAC